MAGAVIGSLRAELSATIAQFQKDMGKAADHVKNVSREFGRVARDFKKTGDQVQSVGKSLTKTLTLPLVALGAAAGAAAMEFDDAFDTIRSQTGATGQRLDDLKASFTNVFTDVPNQANQVAEAIAAISSRTGAVGPALEGLATQIANLARLTQADVGELAASATRAFGDWSIATQDQGESLDFLFRTSQQTGIEIGKLTDLVVQFGAPMRAFGFSFEQTAALMGKFEKEGVNLETVMSGLRFALGKFAEAGKDPAQAFAQVRDAIKNAGSESEATALAFQTFGKRAAIDMSRAIIEGRFNIDELVQSLKAGSDTINQAAADTLSFAERFEILRHRVAAALEPLGTRLLKVLEDLQPQFEAVVGVLVRLVDVFSSLPDSVQSGAIVLGGVGAAIGPISFFAGQAISSLGDLARAFSSHGVATRGFIKGIDAVKSALITLRNIDIGSGLFSILAGGATAGAVGLGIGGAFILAGALADDFRRKLEAQGEAAKRAGKIIPALRPGYISLADAQAKAAESGQELVDGLELTIDAFAKAAGKGQGAQSFADRLAAARREIDALAPAVRRDLVAALEAGVFEMKELEETTGLSEIALKLFQTQLENSKKAAEDAREGVAEVRDEIGKVAAAVGKLEEAAEEVELEEQFQAALSQIRSADRAVEDMTDEAEQLEAALSDIYGLAGDIKQKFDETKVPTFRDALKGLGDSLNDIFQSAFEGGGGLKGAVKSFATNAIKQLSAFIPGVGKVIGQFAGAIVEGFSNLFGKLFGTAGRDAVREFAKTTGGFDALHRQLSTLGDEGERLWITLTQGVGRNNAEQAKAAIDLVTEALERNKATFEELQTTVGDVQTKLTGLTVITPEVTTALEDIWDETTTAGYLAAVQRLNTELDKQKGKYDEVKATLDKYGLSAAAAGKEFRQLTVNESSQSLLKDFRILREAGVDVNEQMRKMGPSIREFIKQAQDMGVEVPENMMTVIQTAIDAGEVFDEDGKKITDIKELGLTFGTTMQEAMESVGFAVDRLTLVLEGLARFLGITLPKAAETGAERIQDHLDGIEDPVIRPRIEFPDLPNVPDIPGAASGGRVTPYGIQHFASGGFARGTDTVPAMLTPGELILNEAQQRALFAPAPVTVNLSIAVDGVFSEGDLEQTVRRRVLPIITEAWDDNVNGSRTLALDVLGVES